MEDAPAIPTLGDGIITASLPRPISTISTTSTSSSYEEREIDDKNKRKSSTWISAEDRAASRMSYRAQLVSRTTTKVLDFVRLTCLVGANNSFHQASGRASLDMNSAVSTIVLVIHQNATVQELADLVTAEHLFARISETVGTNPDNREQFVQEVERTQPILITQLFTPGMLALDFNSIVGDVLQFNDVITVAYLDTAVNPPSRAPTINSFAIGAPEVPAVPNLPPTKPGFDDSLNALLNNTETVAYLQAFCLEEYSVENLLLYMDIEALQTCNDDTVIDYCKYIYCMYFAPNAPISIIISPDIKAEIAKKVANIDDLDVTVYDATQEQVLATLQSFLHPRFLASKFYAEMCAAREAEPSKFSGARILSFATAYPMDMKSIKKCSEIITNPTSPTNHHLLVTSFNNGNQIDMNTNEWREVFLSHVVKRYDKAGHKYDPDQQRVKGYFDKTVRKRWELKQRRIQKEKKLSKFFGQRVGEHEMKRQVVRVINDAAESSDGSPAAVVNLKDILKAIEDLDNESGDMDAVIRRKKIDKLRNIFGDQIPAAPPSLAPSSNSNGSLENLEDEPITTVNDLTPAARKLLNKRNKKLVGILGETVDSKHVVGGGEVVAGGVRQSLATNGPAPSLTRANMARQSLGFAATSPSANMPQPAAAAPILFGEVDELAEDIEKPDEPQKSDTNTIDLSLADDGLISKESRKKRIDKLSKLFGQRVMNYTVVDANKVVKVKSFEQKMKDRRKSSKLEAMMGATLTTQERRSVNATQAKTKSPRMSSVMIDEDTDELMEDSVDSDDDSAAKRIYHFITTLASTIQHTVNVDELLDLIGCIANEITGKVDYVDDGLDPVQDLAALQEIKAKRVIKMKKFLKMSGVTVNDYIDTQIIRVLEVQIRILVTDSLELDVLKEEATTLRSILSNRSADFQQQIDQQLEVRNAMGTPAMLGKPGMESEKEGRAANAPGQQGNR
ncbi:hypothetical protein HDU81_003658 [Chytriomyces hyalinus]|nr:hypothetical protein HDU81_003658 [Chytriomyces hyalinus]